MFKSNDDACVKPSRLRSMYCIFWIVNGFLQIISFYLIELDNNITVTLFFGWINVEAPQYGILTFLGTPIWQRL